MFDVIYYLWPIMKTIENVSYYLGALQRVVNVFDETEFQLTKVKYERFIFQSLVYEPNGVRGEFRKKNKHVVH